MSDPSRVIADLRKSYERGELDESASHADPLQQFALWMQQALSAELPEPNAMTVATVGADGRPSTRVVLIKGYDARGIVWYTNYESQKGQELAGNPYAALQFHWVELERVVRIEGRVDKVSEEESDAYFASRPLAHRIGAWASPQSEVIASRALLVGNAAKFGLKYAMNPPRPPHWGGYRLVPDAWQFWQGRRSRLHDRLRYTLQADGGWLRERLAPALASRSPAPRWSVCAECRSGDLGTAHPDSWSHRRPGGTCKWWRPVRWNPGAMSVHSSIAGCCMVICGRSRRRGILRGC